jgi:hypothetical protein
VSESPGKQQQVRLQINLPEQQRGGVWANFARVHHSPHEFTLDFVRIDFASLTEPESEEERPTVDGTVVARVGVSPLFVRQLIAALEDNWSKYAEKAMPKEVYGGDEPDQG